MQIPQTCHGKPLKGKPAAKRLNPRRRRYSLPDTQGFASTAIWQVLDPLYVARANEARKNAPKGRTPGHCFGIRLKTYLRKVADGKREVKRLVRYMTDKKIFTPENDVSEEAFAAVLLILRTPGAVKDKLAAARTLLEYTQKKPVAASEVTLNKAESFLDAVLADEKKERDDAKAARSAETPSE